MAAVGGEEPALPPGFALAWGLAPAPATRRGPKPAHSVEEIVAAAIRLADAEGSAALSMPRIAARLGVTANALYRYVSSKDELLVLIADAAWGRPPDSVREPAHWRGTATAWVHAVLDRYRAHPWLLEIPVLGAPVTPNLLCWLEVLLAGMTGARLDDKDLLGCAVLLDGYARSTASLLRDLSGGRPPVRFSSVTTVLHPLLGERGYPVLARMLAAGAYEDGTPTVAEDVDFGLARVLDGIETLIAGRAAAVAAG